MATYIGVDVGKKSLQVYLPDTAKSFSITNSALGFKKLLPILSRNFDLSSLIVVFEPTGGYEKPLRDSLRDFLRSCKINFATVHPNKVRQYAKAKGLLAKNDNLDSKLLHDYATNFSLPVKCDYNTQIQEELHSLIKRREQMLVFRAYLQMKH